VAGIAGAVLLGVTTAQCADSAAPLTHSSPQAFAPSSQGFVTYRLMGGDIYKLDARPAARPVDVSVALDRLAPRALDEWLSTSPDGRWFLTSTERFGCGGWACLARVSASLRSGGALKAPGGVLHADGFGAISSDGRLVVYPQGGGAHTRDLWVTRLRSGHWTSPKIITAASPYEHNTQPAISADGRQVLFDCGPGLAGDPGTAVCSVSDSGGAVTVVMAPDRGPGGTARNEVHHPDFAPGGDVIFEADWRGEQIWRLPHGSSHAVLVSRVHNDNSPCALPDGRIASLYLDRPGNRDGLHEIRVANERGGHGTEILTGRDVLDIGIGCG
jgi:hypothetical protein